MHPDSEASRSVWMELDRSKTDGGAFVWEEVMRLITRVTFVPSQVVLIAG